MFNKITPTDLLSIFILKIWKCFNVESLVYVNINQLPLSKGSSFKLPLYIMNKEIRCYTPLLRECKMSETSITSINADGELSVYLCINNLDKKVGVNDDISQFKFQVTHTQKCVDCGR